MPEINDAEYRSFVRYQNIGTPDEVEKKIRDLEKDNGKQRDEIRDLKDQVPKDGAVIIPKDDAEALTAFKALGKKPEEVKASLSKAEQDQAKLAQLERSSTIRDAAEAAGYKAAVLEKLPGSDKLKFEIREETVRDAAGKESKAKVVYVTGPEQGATPRKLSDHTDAEWKDFLPALKSTATDTGGTSYTPQTGGGGNPAPPKDAVEARIQSMNKQAAARTNPLLPQKPT